MSITINELDNLISRLQSIRQSFGSHKSIEGQLDIYLGNAELQIASIEPIQHLGCGCAIGAEIKLTWKESK